MSAPTRHDPEAAAEASAAGADSEAGIGAEDYSDAQAADGSIGSEPAPDPLIAQLTAFLDMVEAQFRGLAPADDIPADVPRFEVW